MLFDKPHLEMKFMKELCNVCAKARGKRLCSLHGGKSVCPVCCASVRNEQCAGCFYFQISQKYQNSKVIPFPKPNEDPMFEINHEIDDRVDQALEMLEKGSIDQGATFLKGLLDEHPANCNVLFGMGVLHITRKQYDEAIDYFKKVVEISPGYIQAYYNIAVAYKEKLDIGNMLRAFQKVVSVGNSREAFVRDAAQHLAKWNQHLLKENKTNIDGYLRGLDLFKAACDEMEQQNWRKAIGYFKKVLSITANHYQSFGNIGLCYAKLGLKQEALHALDQAIRLNPDYEVAVVNKAIISNLEEGECLKDGRVKIIDYAKDYSLKNKSYITEMQ
jgi:tetratricopeptide (TPR) repeat protein